MRPKVVASLRRTQKAIAKAADDQDQAELLRLVESLDTLHPRETELAVIEAEVPPLDAFFLRETLADTSTHIERAEDAGRPYFW